MGELVLNCHQRQRLRRQLSDTQDVRLFRRTLAILEVAAGRSVSDIARMLAVTRQSVYNWIEMYVHAGHPSALVDESGRGRSRLLDEDDEHLLQVLLAHSPQDVGYPNTTWTVPLLRDFLELASGRQLSEATLRRTLRRLNYVWKRPRYVLDPDPEREKKTPNPASNSHSSAPQRRFGGRRNRSVDVPTAAGRVVEARTTPEGGVERP